MRFASIASGSSGNCIYAGTDNTHILIDAGISKKRIESGLNEFGLSLKDIDAILVIYHIVLQKPQQCPLIVAFSAYKELV